MSAATDGFRLAYDRAGDRAGDQAGGGPSAVLLHGWPGDRRDYRRVVPLLAGLDVVVPDLRGFGESDKHPAGPAAAYSAAAARHRQPDSRRRRAARVLVPVVPPARAGGAAHRRATERGARLPGAFLVALVGPA